MTIISLIIIFAAVLVVIFAHAHVLQMREVARDQAEARATIDRLRAITGPVIDRPPIDVFTWVVRKQNDGRAAVLPMTKDGVEQWNHAIAFGLDWSDAWDRRNREQRAIGK
jgi:hypothetical protein